MRTILGIALAFAASAALATQDHTCQGGHNCNTTTPGGTASSSSTSSAAAAASAVGVGVGLGVGKGGNANATGGNATGGNATGGNASANPTAEASANGAPVNVTSKTLALGGTGLAASANACQGSLSIGPIGGTYTVDFCAKLEIVRGMIATGFTVESQREVMCSIEQLKNTVECKKVD